MFSASVESTIVVTAVALWFAQGWYLNTRLREVHGKLDQLLEAFGGLRTYLYEVDPQFDEERRLAEELEHSLSSKTTSFSGMSLMELTSQKKSSGRRTLDTPL